MIKIIDSKYTNDEFAKTSLPTDACHLIISKNEIIYLKTDGIIYIDKYTNMNNNPLIPMTDKEGEYTYATQLYNYNTSYLDFTASTSGHSLSQFQIFKGTNRALCYTEPVAIDERSLKKDELELNREELEKIFDKNNYDSMYVIYKSGRVLFANNKTNGLVIDKNIVPTDEEIINKELNDRKNTSEIAGMINRAIGHPIKVQDNQPKTIDEIENLKIYAPIMFGIYSDMLITVKDNKFSIKWFRLDFLKKDKFKLTISEVPITEISIDNVINESRKDDLRKIEYYKNVLEKLNEKSQEEPVKQNKKKKWF